MAAPIQNVRDVTCIAQDKVDEARRAFFIKHADATPEKYDPRDLDKLRSCNLWVKLFLLHQKEDIDKTVKMIESSLSWRKSMGVLDISEANFKTEDLEKGAIYFHGVDRKGDKILYFKANEVKKEADSLRAARCMIAMLLERQQRLFLGQTVVVLLDLTDVGMGNVDIDLIKYLITSFTTYFPAMLSCMMIYDMPWIVNAIWSIIKQLLSEEEQKHVVFVKKATIQQYVSREQLWRHMGGTDDYVYRYVPWSEPALPVTELPGNGEQNGDLLRRRGGSGSGSGSGSPVIVSTPTMTRRLVPLARAGSELGCSANDSKKVSFREDGKKQEINDKVDCPDVQDSGSNGLQESVSRLSTASNDPPTGTLVLEPPTELVFARVRPEDESRALLRLKNDSKQQMLYKVKTTNPDHYRVKSSAGSLDPGAVHTVQIALLGGKEVKADKFLVQFAFADDSSLTEAPSSSLFWSSLARDRIKERRLRCVMKQWRPARPLQLDHEGEQSSNLTTSGVAEPNIVPSSLPLQTALSSANFSAGKEVGSLNRETTLSSTQSIELASELRSLHRMARLNTALMLLLLALFAIFVLPEHLWPRDFSGGLCTTGTI